MLRRGDRSGIGFVVVMMIAGAAEAVSAAQISPGFPTPDPAAGKNFALSYQYTVDASLNITLPGNVLSDSQQVYGELSDSKLTLDPVIAQNAEELGSPYNATDSISASVSATIGAGRGSASAQTIAAVGQGFGTADVVIEALDYLVIDQGGVPDFQLINRGSLETNDNRQGSAAFSSATFTEQVYLWSPFEGVPSAGQTFFPAYFKTVSQTAGQAPSTYEYRDNSQAFTTGSAWYMGLRIEVQADSHINTSPYIGNTDYLDQEAIADYSHTFALVITADASTPDFSMTSASGFDYSTPLPEPSAVVVMGIVSVMMGLLGRKRRGDGTGLE